jgi:formylglycine-generating enzyme required for sulfatase activity
MDSAILTQLESLKPDAVIGPDHHRFRLKEALDTHHPLGRLWLAEDVSTRTPTPVTLLFLEPLLLGQSGFVEKLRDTLNRNRALKDRHVARCYGLFSWRKLAFASWEALDGLTLAKMFADGRAGKLNDKQKRGLITQVGKALEAHIEATGQPHATLCADLIYINRGNGVRLMGYGWRPLLDPLLEILPAPPGYRAWQSADAFHPNVLDATEDVFALGCMIYQVYSGRPAYTVEDDEASRVQRELKAPSGLTKSQWKVLQSALSPDPDERPLSPLELLRLIYEDPAAPETPAPEVNEAPQPPAPENALSREKKGFSFVPGPRMRLALGGAALFIAGVLLGYQFASNSASSDQSRLSRVLAQNAELQRQLEEAAQQTETEPATEPGSAIDKATARNDMEQPPVDAPIVNDAASLRTEPRVADNLTVFRDQWAPGQYAPQMVVIPEGRFRMGDLHGRGDDNEYPVHEVILDTRFALSRFEVTFEEYDLFAQETGRTLPNDEGWGRGTQPVVNVSWHDAQAYTRWLAAKTGEPYRLPTEAEWEYVARAGTETIYWWGDEATAGMAVCDGCGTEWDALKPAPVGSVPANPWGVHDLNGNVDEWVQDCYAQSYDSVPTDGQALEINGCQHRVMRGGSWFDIPRVIRSASRYRHPPDTRRNSWGFRVALDLKSGTP